MESGEDSENKQTKKQKPKKNRVKYKNPFRRGRGMNGEGIYF